MSDPSQSSFPASPEGKRTGRPPLPIDPKIVQALARIHCTQAEIAAVVGCHESTIQKRFGARLIKWREAGKVPLRRAQFRTAVGGNATMQIWLGKQYLEQRDRHTIDLRGKLTVDQLRALTGLDDPEAPAGE